MRRGLPWIACALAMLLSAPLFIVERVLAITRLTRSFPAIGQVLQHSPSEVFAWFDAPLTDSSTLEVYDSEFKSVAKEPRRIDPNDVTLMRVRLNVLPPGRYTVRWQTENQQGDINDGMFDFTVQLPPVSWLPLAVGGGAIGLVSLFIWWQLRQAEHRRAAQNSPFNRYAKPSRWQ